MPAGDAGLERQALSEQVRERLAAARLRIDDVLSDRDAAPFHEILDNTQQLTDQIERLQAQLAAQQAVVEQTTRLNHQLAAECAERHYDQHRLRDQIAALVAWIRARQHIESDSLTDEQILSAVNGWAELQAQAEQPEGERG